MKVRITAQRWDQPIEAEAREITLRQVGDGITAVVILDGKPALNVELHPDVGERVEIIA